MLRRQGHQRQDYGNNDIREPQEKNMVPYQHISHEDDGETDNDRLMRATESSSEDGGQKGAEHDERNNSRFA